MKHLVQNISNRFPVAKATLALLLGCWFAFTPAAEASKTGPLEVEITLENYEYDFVLLAYHFGNKQYIQDTLFLEGNTARITYQEGLPVGVYLCVLQPDNRYFEFIVNEDDFKITVDAQQPVETFKAKGSQENKLFYEYLRFSSERGALADSLRTQADTLEAQGKAEQADALRERVAEVSKEIADFREQVIQKHPDAFLAMVFDIMRDPEIPEPPASAEDTATWKYQYFKAHYFPEGIFQNDDALRTPVFHQRLVNFFDTVVPQHPDSIAHQADRLIDMAEGDSVMFQYVLVTILNKYVQSKVMGMDAVYVHLIERYYLSGKAHWVAEETLEKMRERVTLMKPTLIGKTAPDLTMMDLAGRKHTLHELDAEYTILYFYDHSCGHCKKVSPKMAKVYDRLAEHGVAWYAIDIVPDQEKMKKFVEDHEMHGLNVADFYNTSGFRQKYDIQSTPVTLILDADKKIIAKKLSPEQVEDLLERMLELETDDQQGEEPGTTEG